MFRFCLLMRKEFLQFFRNLPLIIIVLYSVTYDVYSAGSVSMDLNNYPIAVYDLDQSQQSRDVIEKLREPYFRISHRIDDEGEIKNLIESGEVSVVLVFPHDFGKKISSYQTAEVQAILDGAISNSSELAVGYISNIIDQYNSEILFTKWMVSDVTKSVVPYVEVERRYLYNPNLIDRWNFSLQELFIDVTLLGMLLIATAMVNEKQFGTIEQLMVTPLKIYEIMFSKIVPMIVILFFGVFISVFVTLKYWVGMPLQGSMLQFFFVTLLYVFTVAGLGLMISTISSNLSDTVLFSILVLVPILFLSGAFVPLESTPKWMQYMIIFSPLKYYSDIGTGILLKGNSMFFMWKQLLILAGMGGAWFTIGAIRFRKAFQ